MALLGYKEFKQTVKNNYFSVICNWFNAYEHNKKYENEIMK